METIAHIFIDDHGVPRTMNHRVKVSMIGQKHVVAGESVQNIAEHYDITLADVHAALVYYYDHQAEIDAQIQAELAEIRTAQAAAPPSPFVLRMQAKGIL